MVVRQEFVPVHEARPSLPANPQESSAPAGSAWTRPPGGGSRGHVNTQAIPRSLPGPALLLCVAAGLLCGLAPWGCVVEPPLPGDPQERVVALVERAPRGLDPRFTIDATSMNISRMVFSALISVDNETLTPTFDLAMGVEADPENPRRQIVTLRPGIQFHDGHPLTATDVEWTYRSVLNPELNSPYRPDYAARFRDVRRDPSDPLKVIFELHRPYATFLTDLVLGIVPRHVMDTSGRFPTDTLIGTGPFRFVTRHADREIVLEANPLNHPAPPAIRWLVFRVIADEGTRLLALLGGSADILLADVSPVLLERLREEETLEIHTRPSISFAYLGLNLREGVLTDPRVRKALSLAIDRDGIIAHRYRGHADLARGMLAPFHWAFNSSLPTPEHAPRRAEKLLDEAGLSRNPDTGIRVEFTLKLSSNRFRKGVATMLQRQLAEVGIRLRLEAYEFPTFFADVRAGHFQIFLLELPEPIEPDMYRWMLHSMNTPDKDPRGIPGTPTYDDRRFFPHDVHTLMSDPRCGSWARQAMMDGVQRMVLHGLGHGPNPGIANRTAYGNPLVDCRVDLGLASTDPRVRKSLYGEVQRILAEDLPVIPLWHPHEIAITRRRVQGLKLLPNGRFAPLASIRLDPLETSP